VVLQTEDSLQLLADVRERVKIVSRDGAKIKVRTDKGIEILVSEEFTTNDLDEVAAAVATLKEKRRVGAVAAKMLRQASGTAAAIAATEIPKQNEQQIGLHKMRIRELQAAIAAAETRKAQLLSDYSRSVNGWGNRYTYSHGRVYYAKKAGITGGSAPDSAENTNRTREAQRLSHQIAAWRAELQQLERAVASAQ
jgi:hypothetical protein